MESSHQIIKWVVLECSKCPHRRRLDFTSPSIKADFICFNVCFVFQYVYDLRSLQMNITMEGWLLIFQIIPNAWIFFFQLKCYQNLVSSFFFLWSFFFPPSQVSLHRPGWPWPYRDLPDPTWSHRAISSLASFDFVTWGSLNQFFHPSSGSDNAWLTGFFWVARRRCRVVPDSDNCPWECEQELCCEDSCTLSPSADADHPFNMLVYRSSLFSRQGQVAFFIEHRSLETILRKIEHEP